MDRCYSAGGSFELAGLIDEHGECILSDLKAYYGVDLLDVLIPESGLTPLRVLAYIRNLPVGSATLAAIRGGEQFRDWDVQTYMLANIVDVINHNTYAFVAANSKKKPKPPKPVDRPVSRVPSNPIANKFAAMARIVHARSKKRKKDTNVEPRGE